MQPPQGREYHQQQQEEQQHQHGHEREGTGGEQEQDYQQQQQHHLENKSRAGSGGVRESILRDAILLYGRGRNHAALDQITTHWHQQFPGAENLYTLEEMSGELLFAELSQQQQQQQEQQGPQSEQLGGEQEQEPHQQQEQQQVGGDMGVEGAGGDGEEMQLEQQREQQQQQGAREQQQRLQGVGAGVQEEQEQLQQEGLPEALQMIHEHAAEIQQKLEELLSRVQKLGPEDYECYPRLPIPGDPSLFSRYFRNDGVMPPVKLDEALVCWRYVIHRTLVELGLRQAGDDEMGPITQHEGSQAIEWLQDSENRWVKVTLSLKTK